MTTATGTHYFVPDPRNAEVLIDVNGEHVPRPQASVSVFDSGFMLGDGVWEGLRVHQGRIAFLDRHLDRLYRGAKAIAMDIGLTKEAMERRLYALLDANGMDGDGVHIRLMVTRGVRSTPYQDPRVVISPPTIVIIPEWKAPVPETATRMLKLFTVHVRRGYPDVQDPKLNSHSKLNCITACIQAAEAGADEALMLDPHGFVATCNSTHFFIVRDGEIWTSSGDYCLDGITRGLVLEVAREAGIPAYERNFSLTDVYGADEAFTTGTFAGVAPVGVDRRARDLDRARADGRAAAVALPRQARSRRRGAVASLTLRIAMWSGPRNISTAMMRSFSSRPDCFVSDEPFYGAFLKETGADHPMADEVIASMETDWRKVADALAGDPPDGSPIWYQKHMAHHMVGPIAPDDLEGLTHAFLIRNPARMVASYARKREAVTAADLGLKLQREFFDRECERLGHAPPVVDSAYVLAEPQGTLVAAVLGAGHQLGPGDASLAGRPSSRGRGVGAALV